MDFLDKFYSFTDCMISEEQALKVYDDQGKAPDGEGNLSPRSKEKLQMEQAKIDN